MCTAIVCVHVYNMCILSVCMQVYMCMHHVYVYKSTYFYNIVILHALCVLFPVDDIVQV